MNLETMYFAVEKIDGDYAHLKRIDAPGDGLRLVARELLPEAIREGSYLKYANLSYELMEAGKR